METDSKIKKLWRYLRIQDNQVLIIPVYKPELGTDVYLVTEYDERKFKTIILQDITNIISSRSFRIIQQRNVHGKHDIPVVERIINDELMDY